MVLSSIPAITTAAEEDCKVITSTDLFYTYGTFAKLTYTIEQDDAGEYIHCIADPGSYGNNDLIVAVTFTDFAVLEYPYIAYGYRTNSQKPIVDVGQINALGENWMNSNPGQTTNGTWNKMVVNFNDINGNTAKNLPAADEYGVTFRLKPWGSHGKTLNSSQYFDLLYVAAFKTEEEAKAFKFNPDKDYGTNYNPTFAEDIPYYLAEQSDIDKYMNEAYDLIDEIKASKTDVKYTGTAYYVSHKGDDNNDGLTPQSAWKSVEKINGADFLKEGDAVFFERGGTYRYTGTILACKGVTYSAFGSGAKPKMVGSIDASLESDWIETDVKNVYKYNGVLGGMNNDVGQIVFDMGRAWGIKLQNGLWIGKNSNGLEMIDSGTPSITSPEGLHNDLEYWHNWNEADELYLYSKDGNPATRFSSIEIVDKGHGFSVSGRKGVTVDNLEFFGFGSHGVSSGTTEDLLVQNCVFSFIGGSRQYNDWGQNTRFGNAVEIYGGGKNFTIRNCYAHNIYDCCWTIQYQSDSEGKDIIFENVEFYNNVACYSNTGLEVWLNNKKEFDNAEATYGMKNLHLHHNYTFYNGYGWSQQRPNKDGNIFYGDPSVTTTVYENCSVDNNVGLFASKWLNYVRYVGTEHYNFNNNVYFQHRNKYFGGVPQNPEKGTGTVGQHLYDAVTMSKLLASGFEPGSKFYYVEPDYQIPQYTPEIMTFDDISEEHWAYKNVEAAVMRGYFNGVSETKFAPNNTMTRAMLVTVLSRLTKDEIKIQRAPYTDVSANAWYAGAVNWAYSAGLIADGVTKFRPDDVATREEMADMLYRFTLGQYKCDSFENKALTFSDAASVKPEYKAGIAFATENGIITGYPDGTVKPGGTATRAEVATMMKRFATLYGALEADYSKVSDKTDFHVFTGNELSAKMSTQGGDKKVDNVTGYLSFFPGNPELTNSSNPRMTIYERFLGFKLADYPYVKVRMNMSGSATRFGAGINKNGNERWITPDITTGEWTDAVFCVYDMIKPSSVYEGALNGTLLITPWSENNGTKYNVDKAYIEYIGFFPTKQAAESYQSELQQSAAEISFVANGAVVQSFVAKKGDKLAYPNFRMNVPGYKFTGWDVPEGTVIDGDMTITAIIEKVPGEPIAYFDTNTTTTSVGGTISVETLEEDGRIFYRFSTAQGTSADNTRAYIQFDNDKFEYDVLKAPIMKFGYRTNIESSKNIDFNIRPSQGQRLWGPKLPYEAKGVWKEGTYDLTKLNYIGGESVEAGLKPEEYADKYIKDELYSFLFKPYEAPGLAMKAGEYLDIAYIAFFETEADAALFTFKK